MSSYKKEDNILHINIKVFVHYPEVYNDTVINNRLNKFFDKIEKQWVNFFNPVLIFCLVHVL